MTNEHTPERVTSRETDRLAVLGIEAFGHHGVFEFERREGQVFKADLVLGIESDPVDLIETLAQRLADVCLADPRVQWTEVTVHKPDAPVQATFSDVTLTITRTRSGAPDRD